MLAIKIDTNMLERVAQLSPEESNENHYQKSGTLRVPKIKKVNRYIKPDQQ